MRNRRRRPAAAPELPGELGLPRGAPGSCESSLPICGAHLQTLDVSNSQVTDLTPLASLSALKWLSVSRSEVTDLIPLAALSALQTLHGAAVAVAVAVAAGSFRAAVA